VNKPLTCHEGEKPGLGQAFSEYVQRLSLSRYVTSEKVFIEDLFADEMVINLYVFGASVENRIRGQGEGTKVINP
jgi:hypothetical protein